MIVTRGEEIIVQFLARKAKTWANTLTLGIGETAATVGDTNLEYGVISLPIDNFEYDLANDKITIRSVMPQNLEGTFYELGIFSADVTQGRPDFTTNITNFNEFGASITGGTVVDNTNLRLNTGGVQLSSVNEAVDSVTLIGYGERFLNTAPEDVIKIAVYSADANNASFVVTLNSADGAYTFDATAQISAGYNIVSFPISSMTTSTGNESLTNIGTVSISITSTATFTNTVELDGFRVERTARLDGRGIISRAVPVSPIVKIPGSIREVIYDLGVTF